MNMIRLLMTKKLVEMVCLSPRLSVRVKLKQMLVLKVRPAPTAKLAGAMAAADGAVAGEATAMVADGAVDAAAIATAGSCPDAAQGAAFMSSIAT